LGAKAPGVNVREFGAHQDELGRVIDPDEHDYDRSREDLFHETLKDSVAFGAKRTFSEPRLQRRIYEYAP
jgi:hypothetical protein